jgi:hypothetical protein
VRSVAKCSLFSLADEFFYYRNRNAVQPMEAGLTAVQIGIIEWRPMIQRLARRTEDRKGFSCPKEHISHSSDFKDELLKRQISDRDKTISGTECESTI